MKDISDRPITAEHFIHTIENYNKLVQKILIIEKEMSFMTIARKIRYIIYEIITDAIAFDLLIQVLFGQSIIMILRDIYSYILGLF